MNYFQTLFLVLFLASCTYSLEHDVFVKFGNQNFQPIKGSLKMVIHRENSNDVLELNNDVELKPFDYSHSSLQLENGMDGIEKVSFYYTLSNETPDQLINRPFIYLQSIKIQNVNLIRDEDGNLKEIPRKVKVFSPPTSNLKIEPKQEVLLIKTTDY